MNGPSTLPFPSEKEYVPRCLCRANNWPSGPTCCLNVNKRKPTKMWCGCQRARHHWPSFGWRSPAAQKHIDGTTRNRRKQQLTVLIGFGIIQLPSRSCPCTFSLATFRLQRHVSTNFISDVNESCDKRGCGRSDISTNKTITLLERICSSLGWSLYSRRLEGASCTTIKGPVAGIQSGRMPSLIRQREFADNWPSDRSCFHGERSIRLISIIAVQRKISTRESGNQTDGVVSRQPISAAKQINGRHSFHCPWND